MFPGSCAIAEDAPPSLTGHPPLRHAIVLVHGATLQGSRLQVGPLDFGDYFRDVPAFIAPTKTPVKIVSLTTDSSIGERAAVLKNFLETDLRGQAVNIVAHSLGGLDARYLATILHTSQVVSITTIGTPHYGTPLADWAWSQVQTHGLWYRFFRLLGYDMAQRRFLKEVTTDGMKLFNQRVPNQPGVQYFSVATRGSYAEGNMSYLLWFPRRWLEGENHPLSAHGNDGLVPYDSQFWGQQLPGSPSLDHLGQMNHHELRFHNREREALGLYLSIYENLEKAGL